MRFFLQLILIALLAYLLEFFLPWYAIAIAAFVGSVAVQSRSNFLAGFFGIALLWLVAAWIMDSNSSSGLADRVALILPLQQKSLLFLLTAVLGGLVGGTAAIAGAALRKEKRRY